MVRYIIAVVFLAVCGFAGWIFYKKLVVKEAIVQPVVVDTAQSVVLGTVTVNADYTTEIRAGEGGRLLEVFIDEGQEVVEGDVVATLDTRDLELELEARQIDLDLAQKQLLVGNSMRFEVEVKQEELTEMERLASLGQRSERDVNAAKRELLRAKETLELSELDAQTNIQRLENGIRVIKRRMEKMTIRSSIDGIIDDVFAEKGDLISAGASLASIISKKRVVVAEVSEENFAGLKVGQRAVVRFLSLGGALYDAEVLKIFPSADPETQRYSIQLTVDISQEILVPGLTGEVTITVGERQNALMIPTRALMGDHVFVYADGKLEFRQIIFGYRSLTKVEVTEGLAEGELVVVEDLGGFRNGDLVSAVERQSNLGGS
jgi:RND family efflux transporter MFP subunit